MTVFRYFAAALFLLATDGRAATVDDAPFDRAVAVARAAGFEGVIATSDGEGLLQSAPLGFADREHRRPHRVDERWPWASVTKQMTAVLVMTEIEKGTLSIDSTIASVLPAFTGTTGDRVTVRQLLQHTSGLPNPGDTPSLASGVSWGVPRFYAETGPRIADRARAAAFCSGSPIAAPGEKFSYNNCDYLILGALLEHVTGIAYPALVAQRLGPFTSGSLRMAPDGAFSGGTPVVGYDGNARVPRFNVATFGAAGALTGTVADLLALDRALIDRRIVGAVATETMWTGDPKLGYEALGVWSFPARLPGCAAPVRLIERRGDVAGIQVRNVIAPDLRLAFVAFTNRDDLDFGEIWQGKGLSYDLLGAAFCGASAQTS